MSAASASNAAWGARDAALAPHDSESDMSIGEVLAHLRPDFPDTTISKLRFLEAEGLVEPRRTAAGYRKYTWADVARLRYVLTAQRDHYLPLRVIREHLAALDRGEMPVGPRPTLVAVADAAPEPVEDPEPDVPWVTAAELLDRSGVSRELLRELERHGLVAAASGGGYPVEAVEIAAVAGQLAEFGVEPRHLRPYRTAADREVGMVEQLVTPVLRQNGAAARARAAETVRELTALTQRLHAALVRAGLRQSLGR